MLNTPKGIILFPAGPYEKIKDKLIKCEIIDEGGKTFSSRELGERLQNNLNDLANNPILKKQQEMQQEMMKLFENIGGKKEEKQEKQKKKRFGLF